MSWSISEVARESGVTSRTLRHYHAIGLLTPAWTADGGRRYYEQEQLLRLQRILLLRDLGLSLQVIGEILTDQHDRDAIDALTSHRRWLLAERGRLDRLIATVEETITTLREGKDMNATTLFQGFEHNPYEAEARRRWGDAAIDDSYVRMRGWTPEQAERARTGFDAARDQLAELRDAGVPVADERVQQVVHGHYRWLCLFWTPTRDAYEGLANTYLADDRFRRNIGNGDDSLVAYLRDAMKAYADVRLS